MVTTKLNLSMTEPQVRQIYAKQGDTGRVLDISLDQTPEDGTLRILRPDGVEVTSEAVTGGEVSESGETVTFESMTEADVTELTVGIEPVQDLNGYDAPWVGGAGKNLFTPNMNVGTTTVWGITYIVNSEDGSITCSGTATGNAAVNVMRFVAKAGVTYTLSGTPSTASSSNIFVRYHGPGENDFTFNYRDTGGKVTFSFDEDTTGYVDVRIGSGLTVNNLVFKPQIEIGSSATAWTPYSNICPITGHDEVTVTDTGKNLFSGDTVSLEKPSSRTKNVQIETIPAGTYVLSWEYNGTSTDTRVYFRKGSNVTDDQLEVHLTQSSPVTVTFTVDMVIAYFFIVGSQTDGVTAEISKIMIRKVGTPDSYEPYRSNTYTTSLGQTVYGGTLDMVSGVLTVDRAYYSATWANGGNATSLGLYTRKDFNLGVMTQYLPSKTRCNVAPFVNGYSLDELHYYCYNTAAFVFLPNDTDGTTPIQVVYPLATPQTYQLTPQQIQTLLGTNNVWASSGDIVNITFTYGGLLSELPSEATSVVGKCYCDVEQNGVSSMPFTLNVKKNERES